jgi:hypothetical protein
MIMDVPLSSRDSPLRRSLATSTTGMGNCFDYCQSDRPDVTAAMLTTLDPPLGTNSRRLQQGFTTGGMGSTVNFASQQLSGPNVRFGSKADIEAVQSDVRFTPESGH